MNIEEMHYYVMGWNDHSDGLSNRQVEMCYQSAYRLGWYAYMAAEVSPDYGQESFDFGATPTSI